jgi:hypothetical protein
MFPGHDVGCLARNTLIGVDGQTRDPRLVRLWGWVALSIAVTIAVIWLFVEHPWVHRVHTPIHSVSRIR